MNITTGLGEYILQAHNTKFFLKIQRGVRQCISVYFNCVGTVNVAFGRFAVCVCRCRSSSS